MTADQLPEFMKTDPFQPFTIYLNDGSRLKVTAPDGMFIPRAWKWNAIVTLGVDRFTVVYLRNIAHVSNRGTWPKARNGKRRHDPSDDE